MSIASSVPTRWPAALLSNRATFACAGITMDRWDLNGVEALPEPEQTLNQTEAVTTSTR